MNNENKCDKYEAYFVFNDEKDFINHIKDCPDCQKEHDMQQKISSLIKEAAPVYLKTKQKQKSVLKKLACCFVLFVGISVYTGCNMYEDYLVQQDFVDNSCISMLGLPTDDYGFFEI